MSGTEQVLFLVVVPVAIVAMVWVLASIGGPRAQQRYRPGRPYEFSPVWYVANHRRGPATESATGEISPADPGRELTASAPPSAAGQARQPTTGGASDRW